MQKYKIITESSYDVHIDEAKSGDVYVSGIFSTAELENANGRKYKRSTLEREVNKIQESYLSKNLPFWGELGHPKTPEPNLDRIAIRTTVLEWKGNNLYGKAKVLDTIMGREAKILLKEGPIGISSRGLGTVEESGYVNDDSYRLLAYDLVANPSNSPSFVKGIYEEKEFIICSDIIKEADIKEIPIRELLNPEQIARDIEKLYKRFINEAKVPGSIIDGIRQLEDACKELSKTVKSGNYEEPDFREKIRRELNKLSTSIITMKKFYFKS